MAVIAVVVACNSGGPFQPQREGILRVGHRYMVAGQCYRVTDGGRLAPCGTASSPWGCCLLDNHDTYVTENKHHVAVLNVSVWGGEIERVWPVSKQVRTKRPLGKQIVASLVGFALSKDDCLMINGPI